MSELEPITREEMLLDGQDLEPITREEMFIKRIYDKTQSVPEPITRHEMFLKKAGDGGGEITVEELSVTANGDYSEQGKAYSPVHVNVEPKLEQRTVAISENGNYYYTPSEGKDGISRLHAVVNVPLPENGYLKKTATTSMSDAEQLPCPSAKVTVTDKNVAKLYLTSDGVVSEDTTPYLYRQSPSGKSCVDLSIVGGTIAWNQLKAKENANTYNGVTKSSTGADGSITLTGTLSSSSRYAFGDMPAISGHKYLICANNKIVTKGTLLVLGNYSEIKNFSTTTSAFILNNTSYSYIRFGTGGSANVEYDIKFIPQCFDLTQMFGSTIADYIYSLETATEGAGVAWFKKLFPKSYYAYQSGKLESVNVASRKVYDSNDTLLATYPIDSGELRGILKIDNNGNLYYDGDTYESDGTVTRRFAELKFGTDITSSPNAWFSADETKETWGFYYNYDAFGAQVFPYNIKAGQIISDKFTKISAVYGVDVPFVMSAVYTVGTVGYIAFRIPKSAIDTPSDSDDLKSKLVAWMQNNPFTVVAELATPTTESATPYTNPQLVGSTEEFIDAGTSASTPTRDVDIPVGQDSKYIDGNIYIKYLNSVTTGEVELADENVIIPLEDTTYISSNGSASVEYWSKED